MLWTTSSFSCEELSGSARQNCQDELAARAAGQALAASWNERQTQIDMFIGNTYLQNPYGNYSVEWFAQQLGASNDEIPFIVDRMTAFITAVNAGQGAEAIMREIDAYMY